MLSWHCTWTVEPWIDNLRVWPNLSRNVRDKSGPGEGFLSFSRPLLTVLPYSLILKAFQLLEYLPTQKHLKKRKTFVPTLTPLGDNDTHFDRRLSPLRTTSSGSYELWCKCTNPDSRCWKYAASFRYLWEMYHLTKKTPHSFPFLPLQMTEFWARFKHLESIFVTLM